MQSSYDTKLISATYDALKAFQLNTINSDTSDLANSKLRDIEASANVFFNSIANGFNMAGYNKEILKEYVPAVVYTMYDGYYIYSPYKNKLDDTNGDEHGNGSDADYLNSSSDATYKEGDEIEGVKPYIYYSCRYVNGYEDFVITYSLDNYITIQGKVYEHGNLNWVNKSGYLLDNIAGLGQDWTYRGCSINNGEELKEKVYDPEANAYREYPYIKINGVKYYDDGSKWFAILNGERLEQENFAPTTNAAVEYYREAAELKNWITRETDYLKDLSTSNAVDENGQPISNFGDYKVFDFGSEMDPERKH